MSLTVILFAGDFRETFVSKPTGKGLSVSFWTKLHFDVVASANDAANVVVNPPSENDTTTMPPPTTPAPPVEKQFLLRYVNRWKQLGMPDTGSVQHGDAL